MDKEKFEARRQELELEEARLRRRLEDLEEIVQSAPGSHRPGIPSRETLETEREITDVVLRLSNIDRERQELSIAEAMAK